MILTSDVPPPDRGQGLCDFDSLWSRKIHKNVKTIGKSWHGEIRPIIRAFHLTYNQSDSAVPGLPNFLIFF